MAENLLIIEMIWSFEPYIKALSLSLCTLKEYRFISAIILYSPAEIHVLVLMTFKTSVRFKSCSRFLISDHDKFLLFNTSVERVDRKMTNFSLKDNCRLFNSFSHSTLVNISAIIWYTSSKMSPKIIKCGLLVSCFLSICNLYPFHLTLHCEPLIKFHTCKYFHGKYHLLLVLDL